ncbi:MAG: hypothetical protein MUF48_22050 [Pirellulaceae bacterium]|nr:hypothetical protein [Pirellulaceae bacterium]
MAGRLGRDGLDPHVLLYYPIYDLWSEYVPVAEPLQLASQSPRAQQLVASFLRLGQMLQRRQIPLTLTDHRYLAQATVEADGTLVIGRQPYSALLVPHDAQAISATGWPRAARRCGLSHGQT